jgi:3-isopropylmalate dehydrogenase
MLLRISLGLEAEAAALEHAVDTVLADGARTRDIAGDGVSVSTTEFGALVRQALGAG